MDIIKVFEDSRIKMPEEDISMWNEHCSYSEEEKYVMAHLLEQRSRVLRQLNVYDEEMKQLLATFNDALRSACAELYRRTMAAYQEYLHRNDYPGDFEVEGKIFLSHKYPAIHPVQTEVAKQVRDALSQGGFEPLYDDGCAWPLHLLLIRPYIYP